MAFRGYLTVAILLSFLVAANCNVSFASLKKTLDVTASPKSGEVLKAGEAKITVSWSLNTTFAQGTDSDYKTVKVKLCYAPISQQDRAWRKTVDNLAKDKTCPHQIVAKPYASPNNFTWIVKRDVPAATYFIRVYALNSAQQQVGYGQTTDAKKTTNLFNIQAITGRHLSLDIASVCFSLFSVVSLFGFFFLEKRKAKASQAK